MRAVFLDRDGVICEHRPDYVKSWEEFRFLPRSLHALRKLDAFDGLIIVVSNQSCIGRGIVPESIVRDINTRMAEQIRIFGGRIDDVYICVHHPDAQCTCRKPESGMLEDAALKYDLNLNDCWVVGDNITDIEMGRSAGCRTILVRTGLGETFSSQMEKPENNPLIVGNLSDAVDIILDSKPYRTQGEQDNG